MNSRKEYEQNYYKKNRKKILKQTRKYAIKHKKERAIYERNRLKDYRTWLEPYITSCKHCGNPKIVFHHLPGTEKLFNVSYGQNYSHIVVVAELGKCICLCRSCHAREHKKSQGRFE